MASINSEQKIQENSNGDYATIPVLSYFNYSDYKEARKNGFEGTEKEWLNETIELKLLIETKW